VNKSHTRKLHTTPYAERNELAATSGVALV